jgi:hypothetical protein
VTIQRCLVDPQGRVIYAGQPTYRADVFRLERSFTL